MATSDAARRELAVLFTSTATDGAGTSGQDIRASDLDVTDPEFLERYQYFAFDEVLTRPSLPRATRLLVQLGAIIGAGGLNEYRAMLPAALNAGLTPVEVKEAVYQSTAYVGSARAFDFLIITNEILIERGVILPLEPQSTTTLADRLLVGRKTQGELVGRETVDGMYDNAPHDAVHFQQFLSGNCFGDYYTRTGLDLERRELLTFAILVGLGGADSQVAGHVQMNLNVGNTRQDLIDVLTVLVPYIGYPRTLNGLNAVNDGAPSTSGTEQA